MSKVGEQFASVEDFRILLDQAKRYANTSAEEDFVDGLEAKFETYGSNMFLSDAQSKWLSDIASRI